MVIPNPPNLIKGFTPGCSRGDIKDGDCVIELVKSDRVARTPWHGSSEDDSGFHRQSRKEIRGQARIDRQAVH